MKKKNTPSEGGLVYSTNREFFANAHNSGSNESVPAAQQDLRVMHDRSHRKGKTVTAITGFRGNESDLEELARKLKSKLATGGSAKDGVIYIQGEMRDRVFDFLIKEGYKAKKAGG
jgi:translation initiation factor 1